jgi:3-ketosteroid 9alpha-monooxygenase subunit A
VAEAADVKAGKMLSVTYLDQQLIVYRDADGKAQVADAYCPHMGAHLASHDGCIKNGQLVCPFHKWAFDGTTGQCTHIPYTQTMVPRSVKLTIHPTREVDGMVVMWYHPEGAAPDYEPFSRDVLSPGARWDLHSVKIVDSTCPFRDLFENLFDTGHVQQLHGSNSLMQIASVERVAHGLRLKFAPYDRPEKFPVTRMETNFSGVTAGYVYIEGKGFGVIIQSSATPVNAERFYNVNRIFIRNDGKLRSKLTNILVGGAFARRVYSEIQQDMNVLNYKKHLARPALCAGDGPITKWRQYQQEFYTQPSPHAAAAE